MKIIKELFEVAKTLRKQIDKPIGFVWHEQHPKSPAKIINPERHPHWDF